MEEVSIPQSIQPVAWLLLAALSQIACDNSKQTVEWEDEENVEFGKGSGEMVSLHCHFDRI